MEKKQTNPDVNYLSEYFEQALGFIEDFSVIADNFIKRRYTTYQFSAVSGGYQGRDIVVESYDKVFRTGERDPNKTGSTTALNSETLRGKLLFIVLSEVQNKWEKGQTAQRKLSKYLKERVPDRFEPLLIKELEIKSQIVEHLQNAIVKRNKPNEQEVLNLILKEGVFLKNKGIAEELSIDSQMVVNIKRRFGDLVKPLLPKNKRRAYENKKAKKRRK